MIRLTVNVDRPYEVIFNKGALNNIGAYIKHARGISKVMIVCDTNVAPLYLQTVVEGLKVEGFCVENFVIEAGEQYKTPQTYLRVINALAEKKFNRTDLVVALGGGVVGDIAGFVAATYMRGIDLVQIPTTFLAAIDSSIGGKTGVNLDFGKNLLGAFHQPRLVVFDRNVLKTLSKIDWENGVGEGIKYGILKGGRIFEILQEGLCDKNLDEFVYLCAQSKIDIVEKDEKEGNQRKLLNLGHTIGHAIEILSDFAISHGIAVVNGIVYMAKVALNNKRISKVEYNKILYVISKYDIEMCQKFSVEQIINCVKMDKKGGKNGEIDYIEINGIGNCNVCNTSLSEFAKLLN